MIWVAIIISVLCWGVVTWLGVPDLRTMEKMTKDLREINDTLDRILDKP